MTIIELSLNRINQALEERAQITYSYLGTPTVSISILDTSYSNSLSALEYKAIQLISTYHTPPSSEDSEDSDEVIAREEARKRAIVTFANKVCQLNEQSRSSLQNAHCISQIFYMIRESLAQLFKRFTVAADNNHTLNLFVFEHSQQSTSI